MANVLVEASVLGDIADAIRSKLNVADTYKPGEMADAIDSISTGITPTGTKSITANGTGIDVAQYAYADVAVPQTGIIPTGTKTITANGNSIDVEQYKYADVSVPNSYSAGDEGKVVSNGALVSQSSGTVTQNGTVDTTLINSLLVTVSGGGGGAQQATGTISLSAAAASATFTCSFRPDVVFVYANDTSAAFTTRQMTQFYFHEGYCGIVRGRNANSTSVTNFTSGLSLTAYKIGTEFGTYYKVDYSGTTCTVTCRSGYGFASNADTTYTWIAIKYTA